MQRRCSMFIFLLVCHTFLKAWATAGDNGPEFNVLCRLYQLAVRDPEAPQLNDSAEAHFNEIKNLKYALDADTINNTSIPSDEWKRKFPRIPNQVVDGVTLSKVRALFEEAKVAWGEFQKLKSQAETECRTKVKATLRKAAFGKHANEKSEAADKNAFADSYVAGCGDTAGIAHAGSSLANDITCLCGAAGYSIIPTTSALCGHDVTVSTTGTNEQYTSSSDHTVTLALWELIRVKCDARKYGVSKLTPATILGLLEAFHSLLGRNPYGAAQAPFIFGKDAAAACAGGDAASSCINYKAQLITGDSTIEWEKNFREVAKQLEDCRALSTKADLVVAILDSQRRRARELYIEANETSGRKVTKIPTEKDSETATQNGERTSTKSADGNEVIRASNAAKTRFFLLLWTLLI